jgi:serine/threonine-protein kinase
MEPPPTDASSRLGLVLQNTYRIERILGVGGMGIVYAAEHVHLRRPVAVKVLHPHMAELAVPLSRFHREAQIASQLGHPGLVSVLDFNFTDDGAPYMVMDLLTGETLTERLSRGPLSVEETCHLFTQLCDALHAVHEAGVVHRDLKPDNIFLTQAEGPAGPQVKILDFGISKMREAGAGPAGIELTGNEILGTPSYLAPEQAAGDAREADRRADIFALGTILYECLTGERAFDGPHATAVLRAMLGEPIPAARLRRPELPEAVDEVIARACARDPAARFATATELCAALLSAAGLPAQEEPAGPGEEAWGDGDTLFDADVAALQAAARAAQEEAPAEAGAAAEAVPAGAGAEAVPVIPSPPASLPEGEGRLIEATTQEVSVVQGAPPDEAARRPERGGERPTALLETLPMPPTGYAQVPRWSQGHDATIDIRRQRQAELAAAPPAERKGLLVTITTAVLAVLVGIVVGMLVLKLMARDEPPSLALERAQEVQQLLAEGEQLAAQGRCDQAVRRASAVILGDRYNARARRILAACQKK